MVAQAGAAAAMDQHPSSAEAGAEAALAAEVDGLYSYTPGLTSKRLSTLVGSVLPVGPVVLVVLVATLPMHSMVAPAATAATVKTAMWSSGRLLDGQLQHPLRLLRSRAIVSGYPL
jgi:hypothetical protein